MIKIEFIQEWSYGQIYTNMESLVIQLWIKEITSSHVNDFCFIAYVQLEDCALQLYKYNSGQGDYGTYLDLESSLEEQDDELEGFTDW